MQFRHQARGEANSVDCVGLLVVIGQKIRCPKIFDLTNYRRVPSAALIRETLELNCDEIGLSDAKPGDIYLMRMGGIKARHTSILYSDTLDLANGIEPQIIHASLHGVRLEPVANFPPQWFVSAFRVRGLIESVL